MNSVQESKNELDAAIRYAENAISSAKQTIESMTFRQEMAQKNYQEQTGREQALQNQVGELKSECAVLAERIDDMKDAAFAEAKTIEHLNKELQRQKDIGQGYYDTMMTYKNERETLEKNVKYLRDENERLNREVEDYTQKYSELAQGMDVPTMPVIPKDVAIAIFREGVQHGVSNACDVVDNDAGISIEETEYCGDFEVSFNRWIDLSDHLDLDWMRDKVGDYDEASVIEALKTLCADKKFECRIHGVDDQQTKDND